MKRSTLVALVVLAALGGYVYWFEREPTSDADAERLFDVEETAIARIELQDHDDPPIILEKRDDRWLLTSPVEAEADATEVDLLLQNLASVGFERSVANAAEVDLEDFGLDAPSVRVRFTTEAGEELGVDFGSDTPTTGNQYARRFEGEDVLVVASYLSNNFQKTPWDLREKKIFDVAESAEPTRVEITRAGASERVVASKEDGAWRVIEPFSARADRFVVTDLVSRFRRAEMAEVVSETPDGLEGTGLEEPATSIRVVYEGDTEPLVLELGSERELEVYARAPSRPEIFLVDETYANDLSKPATELVSKRLLETPVPDVTGLLVDDRDYEKRGSGDEATWHQTSPEERSLSTSAVEDLLYEMSATSAETVLDEAALQELELGEPDHTLTLRSAAPGREETIRIWTPESEGDGGRVYARREGDEVALELTGEAWRQVEALIPKEEG